MRIAITITASVLLAVPAAAATASDPPGRFERVVAGPDGYAADPCVPAINYDGGVTSGGIEFVRSPDEAFATLASLGYPWPPNYVELSDGLRMHYLDVGTASAEIVLLLHGQPTWSYLYRKMIPALTSRGYRVLVPDWIVFGRSDKPTDMAQHTYLKHVERLKDFIYRVILMPQDDSARRLEDSGSIPKINLFVQDWGSLIGLRAVGDLPGWFRRVVVANGILPVLPPDANPFGNFNPVNYNCTDDRTTLDMALQRRSSRPCGADATCFSVWIDFALTNPAWMPSELVGLATFGRHSGDALGGYDVPFPTRAHMAGPRTFPSMMAAVHEPEFGNAAAWEVLKNFTRPFLALAGEQDPNLGSVENQANFIDNVPGARVHGFEHRRYADAGHFIQEDKGEEVASYVADFMEGTAHLLVDGGGVQSPPPSPTTSGSLVVHGGTLLLCTVLPVLQLFSTGSL